MAQAQTLDSRDCEQCGMTVDATSQAHFRVVDGNGVSHYVECMMCALKLLKICEQLDITTYCDYYGPTCTIEVRVEQHGNFVVSNPPDALVIAGGGCTKNRVVYNETAADALLANGGNSNFLASIQKHENGLDGETVVVPTNSTRLTMSQAAFKFGVGVPAQTPTGSQLCEVCGMEVNPDAQMKYKVTDENGIIHFVECFMCALNLVNDYKEVHIHTSCDWYGPNYPITVDSIDLGKEIMVTPATAMFLNGGSCVVNRAAYNQTAVDELLANDFSQYTLKNQLYSLPSTTVVSSVQTAASAYAQASSREDPTQSAILLVAVAVIGVVFVAVSFLAFHKLKGQQTEER